MFIKKKIMAMKKSIYLKQDCFSNKKRQFFLENYGIKIGYGTYGGCYNTINVPSGVSFGNYCSIAPNVKFFRANHSMDYFSMHPLFYNPEFGFVKDDLLIRPALQIGHDVWIGDNVIITPSVENIGNGSVIGAGSVVTKDVLPYSIVAGNPAKNIKKRFSESIINELEKSEWWLLKKDDLYRKRKEFEKIIGF